MFFLLSVNLSAYINAVPTGRISVEFDIRDFCENLKKNPNFVTTW